MAELTDFQRAAVDRIVQRLTDRSGSQRFLLADEVGLGKTMVARGVVDELRRRKRGKGFLAVYICSNNEIAEQNRARLCDEADPTDRPRRLTLLATQSSRIRDRRGESGTMQLFSFTPGTSLRVGNATGIAYERRLLLYLLFRVWRKHVNRPPWREFFRCAVQPDRWTTDSRFRLIRKEFGWAVADDFQQRLRTEWNSHRLGAASVGDRTRLIDAGVSERPARTVLLADCIDDCVDEYACRPSSDPLPRQNRNRIIGALRHCLSRVALDYLQPDLIILDEFQRFKEILDDSRKPASVVGKLFAAKNTSILILSATPYKMYTLAHEAEDHHEDFIRTLAFLRNELPEGRGMHAVKSDLRQFKERLIEGEWVKGLDENLYRLKTRIEEGLKTVMCRTERNWYLEDAAKGVREIPDPNEPGVLPQTAEMTDYIRLRRFLLNENIGEWNITDFWKSGPSILSFMDGQYALIKRLRKEEGEVPVGALVKSRELGNSWRSNLKFRRLFSLLFDAIDAESESTRPGSEWKFLWMPPTYTYYRDDFYGSASPTKILVFSHWRFVPKAIAVLVSREIERRLGAGLQERESSPLQFREKISFYPFDTCYPSPVLAECVSPLSLGVGRPGEMTDRELYRLAEREVRKLLSASGIAFGPTQNAPLWRMIARVEARSIHANLIRGAMEDSQVIAREETSEHYPSYVSRYLEWMDDDEPELSISPAGIERLTLIALYSPAIGLLRAATSVFGVAAGILPGVVNLCLNQLRGYFNKPLVQAVIRRHGSRRGPYTLRVLAYCRKAHFQAVMDEYCYLLRHVLQRHEPVNFLDHLGRVLGMWAGSPLVNEPSRNGQLRDRQSAMAAHFALAFGDDVWTGDPTEASGRTRKSAVREAFNSPFWPFVLGTTSVGQEGLDFHLYCRDIVHWNLPCNPVDLEQREGRINRYDGLCIRQNISRDYALGDLGLWPEANGNLWGAIFHAIAERPKGTQGNRHGLFPHWIYRSAAAGKAGSTDGAGSGELIRRHLMFYSSSRDTRRYLDLKRALALYRLVFGQARQQDILDQLLKKFPGLDAAAAGRSMWQYMINLSPIEKGHALRLAKEEARMIVGDSGRLRLVVADVERGLVSGRWSALAPLQQDLTDLIRVATADGAGALSLAKRTKAVGALLYLLNPYDDVYDFYEGLGLKDDVKLIQDIHAEITLPDRA